MPPLQQVITLAAIHSSAGLTSTEYSLVKIIQQFVKNHSLVQNVSNTLYMLSSMESHLMTAIC